MTLLDPSQDGGAGQDALLRRRRLLQADAEGVVLFLLGLSAALPSPAGESRVLVGARADTAGGGT